MKFTSRFLKFAVHDINIFNSLYSSLLAVSFLTQLPTSIFPLIYTIYHMLTIADVALFLSMLTIQTALFVGIIVPSVFAHSTAHGCARYLNRLQLSIPPRRHQQQLKFKVALLYELTGHKHKKIGFRVGPFGVITKHAMYEVSSATQRETLFMQGRIDLDQTFRCQSDGFPEQFLKVWSESLLRTDKDIDLCKCFANIHTVCHLVRWMHHVHTEKRGQEQVCWLRRTTGIVWQSLIEDESQNQGGGGINIKVSLRRPNNTSIDGALMVVAVIKAFKLKCTYHNVLLLV